MRTKSSKKNKINIITLGCSKNISDSEVLMSQLSANKIDVDNEVLVDSKNTYVRIGDFANVIVKNADHFDFYAEIVK